MRAVEPTWSDHRRVGVAGLADEGTGAAEAVRHRVLGNGRQVAIALLLDLRLHPHAALNEGRLVASPALMPAIRASKPVWVALSSLALPCWVKVMSLKPARCDNWAWLPSPPWLSARALLL